MTNEEKELIEDCTHCCRGSLRPCVDPRCKNCIRKGEIVGKVVWDRVISEVEEPQQNQRAVFMITGLSTVFLKGVNFVAKQYGDKFKSKDILLAIHPKTMGSLKIESPAVSSKKPPTYWRNSDEARTILFAPRDEDLEGAGSSLNTVTRIDEAEIIQQVSSWCKLLQPTGSAETYIYHMLKGLRKSEICINLDMWVNFILAMQDEGSSEPPEIRVQNSLHALRLPKNCISKLPTVEQIENQSASTLPFEQAFRNAKEKVRCYAYLTNSSGDKVDLDSVRNAISEAEKKGNDNIRDSLNAVKELLKDEENLKQSDWKPSQQNFCKSLDWKRLGIQLFEGRARKTSAKLGVRTLKFIEGNYGHDVTDEDRLLLKEMKQQAPKVAKVEEVEFYNRWKDRLESRSAGNLGKMWQTRIFRREATESDLLVLLCDGLEALIAAAGEKISEIRDPKVLVRSSRHKEISYWQSRDSNTRKLFCFEAKSLSRILGKTFEWDIDSCFDCCSSKSSDTADSRKVELDLFLVEKEKVSETRRKADIASSIPRVRISWQQLSRLRYDPISYALPMDIAALAAAAENDESMFRPMNFSPKPSHSRSTGSEISLSRVTSFGDVRGSDEGRMFDESKYSDEDTLKLIRESIAEAVVGGSILPGDADTVYKSLDTFEKSFSAAIMAISNDYGEGFASNLIEEQASAFGSLCSTLRKTVSGNTRVGRVVRPLVAELAIVRASGSQKNAILAGWHPLRLAERRAKAKYFADFASSLMEASATLGSDLEIIFQRSRSDLKRWVFPEVAVISSETMTVVESVGGYSLLGLVTNSTDLQEHVEGSCQEAAKSFIDGVDQYLDTYPYEATSLSIAICESTGGNLPSAVAKGVVDISRKNSNLRCDLTISNSNSSKLSYIYSDQNRRFRLEDYGELSGELNSQVTVSVVKHKGDKLRSDSHDVVDIAILHDAITLLSEPEWVNVAKEFDNSSTISRTIGSDRFREKVDGIGSDEVGRYIAPPFQPYAVSEFQNLLYELAKKAVLPSKCDAALIRRVQFDSVGAKSLIEGIHNFARWVITFDSLPIRALLRGCGVQIIREISDPRSGGCVIVSSWEIDRQIIRNINREISISYDVKDKESKILGKKVKSDVQEISGKKLLTAAQNPNSAKEMIGVCVMKAVLEGAYFKHGRNPIWLSLDDYRGWFMSFSSRTADALALTVEEKKEKFSIRVQVGEAKYVSKSSLFSASSEARSQIVETVERLCSIFVDNDDSVSRAAWCSRLAHLLSGQEDLLEHFSSEQVCMRFLRKLSAGDVEFYICGEVVIGLHDDHGDSSQPKIDSEHSYIRTHVLRNCAILDILRMQKNSKAEQLDGLADVNWREASFEKNSVLYVKASNSKVHESALSESDQLDQHSNDNCDKVSASCNVTSDFVDDNEDKHESLSDRLTFSNTVEHDVVPITIWDILRELRNNEDASITDAESGTWAEEVCGQLQEALSGFGMHAEFDDPKYAMTPNGVIVSFTGHPTLTIGKVRKREEDLFTTHGIRVTDFRMGPRRISLFVRRDERKHVGLASTWLDASWPDTRQYGQLSFLIGIRDDDGCALFLNLAGESGGYCEHGPHTLIAGETGGGKGVLTQGIILQMIALYDPKNVEIVLIDPKNGVDYGWLKGSPHMRNDIVTQTDSAKEIFSQMVQRMEEREKLLGIQGVSHIDEYNSLVSVENRLPRIVLIHDEFGSWMVQEKDYRETVLSSVANLGMRARAVGIHLILVTQRADADMVPPKLRDNMGNRLCLRVQNSTGSRMVLNTGGAERLIGKGHLACKLAHQDPPTGQPFFVAQVPYASLGDIKRLAEAAKSHWGG